MLGSEDERAVVRDILGACFPLLREGFRAYSALGGSGNLFSMGMQEFKAFWSDCGLLERVGGRIADLDNVFVASAVPAASKRGPLQSAKELMRWQFMEALIRISVLVATHNPAPMIPEEDDPEEILYLATCSVGEDALARPSADASDADEHLPSVSEVVQLTASALRLRLRKLDAAARWRVECVRRVLYDCVLPVVAEKLSLQPLPAARDWLRRFALPGLDIPGVAPGQRG